MGCFLERGDVSCNVLSLPAANDLQGIVLSISFFKEISLLFMFKVYTASLLLLTHICQHSGSFNLPSHFTHRLLSNIPFHATLSLEIFYTWAEMVTKPEIGDTANKT